MIIDIFLTFVADFLDNEKLNPLLMTLLTDREIFHNLARLFYKGLLIYLLTTDKSMMPFIKGNLLERGTKN